MKYKIVSMDFDGTLLNDNKEVSEKTKTTLAKLKNMGIYIVGVTGRNLSSVNKTLDINIFNYVVLNNGCGIYDVNNKELIKTNHLERKTVENIINNLLDDCYQFDVISTNCYYFLKREEPLHHGIVKSINNLDDIDEDIARLNIFVNDEEKLNKYIKELNDNYNVNAFVMQDSFDSVKFIVVNPKNIDKFSTLKNLGQILNINLEEMIFFGDGLNDINVIKGVGMGVAMENALDEIKQNAKIITLSNNEDGIHVLLEKFLQETKF